MQNAIIEIGWFVRRSSDPQRLGEFYRDVVGLPELRNYGPTKMLWMGETIDLEPGAGGTLVPPRRSPEGAPCLPVLQTRSLVETMARLGSAGLGPLAHHPSWPDGPIAWFSDPAGYAFGVIERVPAGDIHRLWEPGPTETVGGARLAPDLVRLAEVVRRVADPGRVAAFYRDHVGLSAVAGEGPEGQYLFDLGQNSKLRIVSGGAPLALPEDRAEVVDGFILRVDRVDQVVAELARGGAPVINSPFDIEGGRIAYLADPEGQVFGVQTRLESTNRVEDHEASRRRSRSERKAD